MTWAVFDWAGNRLFPDQSFESFEAAWGFIFETFKNEADFEDLYCEMVGDGT